MSKTHRWQDMVISITQFVFVIALVPSVFSPHKPAILTSCVTAAGLYVLCATFISMRFFFSYLSSFVAATLWLVLLVQAAT